jgi:signal transduction histidine kinase/ActR/RegA family two-component response regulator
MVEWWKNLSVSKKLYGVVGLMALLIAAELFTLLFAMNTLSAVRALVHAEGLWSKGQKDAVQNLQNFVITNDERYYVAFQKSLSVPMGDRRARIELFRTPIDEKALQEGFAAGRIHPDDIDGIKKLLLRFHRNRFIAGALDQWMKADVLLDNLTAHANRIREELRLQPVLPPDAIKGTLLEISALNERITTVEDNFSSILGEASRWLENVLMMLLILAVATVESTGLYLTITFSRSLSRLLRELAETAAKVGQGDFTQVVPVRSRDELGQLAQAINGMTESLNNQVKERQQAEHASQAKNLFLANMSHEIRTPLNAILGFSEMLGDSALPAVERDRYLQIVKRTGKNLATIINDILDLTKVEAEQLRIEATDFSLKQTLADLHLLLKLRAEEAGIALEFHQKGEVAEYIRSDPMRLRQILTNIVGNAIKFTDRGSVTVVYEAAGPQLLFTVQDTGGGIAESQVEQLFKPFSQGDSSVRKKFGGTGLGLVLSKRLAHLLGGDVGLWESVPGVGSTFFVSVAYRPVEREEVVKGTPDPVPVEGDHVKALKGRRVLVVEDTIDSQLLLQLYLGKQDVEVEVANHGLEGVEKACATGFDAILMDMQMPVMDGYSATAELRRRGCHVPIIALTGYAMSGDREKALRAGCSDYLSKPVEFEKLLETLSRCFRNKEVGPRTSSMESRA